MRFRKAIKEEDVVEPDSVDSDTDSIDAKNKNRLVRSIHTRCGRWISKSLQGFEFNKLRVYSREYYNKHRHIALALGKIHEEDNIMSANEAHMLKKRYDFDQDAYT